MFGEIVGEQEPYTPNKFFHGKQNTSVSRRAEEDKQPPSLFRLAINEKRTGSLADIKAVNFFYFTIFNEERKALIHKLMQMHNKQTFKSYILLIAIMLSFTPQLHASHAMGADLQYTCLGNDQYRVTLRFYRDCGGISAPSNVNVSISSPSGCDSSFSAMLSMNTSVNCPPGTTQGCEISQLCVSQISQSECNYLPPSQAPYPGVRLYEYTAIVTIPSSCPDWRIRFTENARNPSNNLVNSNSNNLSIEATLNNAIDPNTGSSYCNNSVTFTNRPVPIGCVNSPMTYNHGAVDADGDSLVYTLVNPLGTGFNPMSFNTNWSVNQPVRTNPPGSFQFDPTTGQMNFTPAFQEIDVIAMQVEEYRNGVLIGSVVRDIQVTVLNCAISVPEQREISNISNGQLIDSVTIQTCPTTPLLFDVVCASDYSQLNVTINSTINATPSAIAGASMTQIGSGSVVTARIQWTPQLSDTGCHSFVLTTTTDDCPINGVRNKIYNICVLNRVQLSSSAPTYCGTPVQLQVTGGSNFSWIPSNGPNAVSDSSIYNPTVSPISPTTYYFSSDCGTDSLHIAVSPSFQIDLGNDTLLCSTDSIQLFVSGQSANGNASYWWSSNNSFVTNNNSDNVVVKAGAPSVFYCVVTDSAGCSALDSVEVSSRRLLYSRATYTPNTVCPRGAITLLPVTTAVYGNCGIAVSPCGGVGFTAQVGSGTGLTPVGSATGYPTIYSGFRKGYRMQMLYRKEELMAVLGGAGQISSIGFEIGFFVSGYTLENFKIKMGCTTADSLTAWQPDLSSVYQRNSYVPVNGWNDHALDSAYVWDGNSNLVVEICIYYPNTAGFLNQKVRFTPRNYRAVYYSLGNTEQCGFTGNPLSSYNLPNIRFNYCQEPPNQINISWSSVMQPNTVADSNAYSPLVYPQLNEIYYFRMYDSLCNMFISDSVAISQLGTVYTSNFNVSVCEGDSFLFGGIHLTQSGTYVDTMNATNGCDSIVTLQLSVEPVRVVNLDATICVNGTYSFGGQILTASGFYSDTLIASNGCDSIVTLNLITDSVVTHAFSHHVCQDSSYYFNGQNLFVPGIYTDTLTAQGGCDSIAVLTLELSQPANVSLNLPIDTVCLDAGLLALSGGLPVGGDYLIDNEVTTVFFPNMWGAGTYEVVYRYTDTNSCVSTVSREFTIVVCTSVKELHEGFSVTIYPNPATDELKIDLGGLQAEKVYIYNIDGKLLINAAFPKYNILDVGPLPTGLYIAEVQLKSAVVRVRFVKI